MSTKSKEKQIINIGVIGCGGIAQNHVFSLSLLENNARKVWKDHGKKVKPRLHALADIDDARLDGFSEHFPVKKLYRGPNCGYDLINDPDVHAVFVLVPTVDHLDYVLKAAEAGKHVFCEKPVAFTPSDIRKMIAARDKHGVVIQVGLVFRSAPQILYLNELLRQNKEKWGKATNIIFRDSQEKPYKGEEEVHNSTWRGFKEKAHAGILFEHTIHDIDGMIFIFGEIEEVFAKVNYHAGREGIEDSVAAILTFKNGINLSVNSMWNDIDYSQRRMEVFFENAYIMITVDERDEKAVVIKVKALKDEEYVLDDQVMEEYFKKLVNKPHIKAEIPGPYYYEDLRFVDAIATGNPAPVTLEQGLYAQRVIEACYESSRSGKIIKIDQFDP
ncbi:MAG: Gfo/Idh/MocA family protein [Promethearchaeota archaeon]